MSVCGLVEQLVAFESEENAKMGSKIWKKKKKKNTAKIKHNICVFKINVFMLADLLLVGPLLQ